MFASIVKQKTAQNAAASTTSTNSDTSTEIELTSPTPPPPGSSKQAEMNQWQLAATKATGLDIAALQEHSKPIDLQLKELVEFASEGAEVEQQQIKLIEQLFVYMFFVALFLTIVFMQRGVQRAYDMNFALGDALFEEEFPNPQIYKTFHDVATYDELYEWIEGPLFGALTATNDSIVYMYNKLIGFVRFRQVRVDAEDCDLDFYKKLGLKCYPRYSTRTASTKKFGTWSYEDLAGPTVWGRLDAFYPSDGFAIDVDFSNGGANATTSIQAMKDNNFLDDATRALFVQMNYANGPAGMISVLTAVFEISQGGAVIPWVRSTTFKISLYTKPLDWVRCVLEIVFLLALIFLTYSEAEEAHSIAKKRGERFGYFNSGWNILDFINLLLFWIIFFSYIGYLSQENRVELMNSDLTDKAKYENLEPVAAAFIEMYNLVSLNVLIAFFKFFKFLSWNRRMTLLWKTFSNAAADLGSFAILFFLLLLGFAFMGFLLFGPQVEIFHDTSSAISTAIQMSLGEFSYDEFKSVNRFLSPLFFAAFILVIFYSAVNMFLAIVTESFSALSENNEEDEDSLNAIQDRFKFFYESLKCKLMNKKMTQTDVKAIDRQIWHRLEKVKSNDAMMERNYSISLVDHTELDRALDDLLGEDATLIQRDRLKAVILKHLSRMDTSSENTKFASLATLALRKKSLSRTRSLKDAMGE